MPIKKRPWSTKATGRDYKKEYKEYQKWRIEYRTELNKINRDMWTYWNWDWKDVSHTKGWKFVLENESINRKRNWMKKWTSPKTKRTWTKK